jgi:Xaa-Pro aminopeptidase
VPILGVGTNRHRLALMWDLMDREGVDALGFTTAPYFQFATNFSTDVRPWERPIVCVIPRSGEPFAVLNQLSLHHWRFRSEAHQLWVRDAFFYAEHPIDGSGDLPLIAQWPDVLADQLHKAGLGRSRIGFEGSIPTRLSELLPRMSTRDLTSKCRALRFVKHAEEIAVMREAAALADWTQEMYRQNIRPGRLVQELDATMAALAYSEAARRFPGEDLQMSCYTLSGPASAAPHGDGRSIGARIERGHVLVNIVEPRLNGLVIENERTWFCGRPTARQIKLFEAARNATIAACEAAVTGNSVCKIDEAARRVFEAAGVSSLIRHRTGHGMGLECHEYPEDMAFNTRPLMEGEVYSAEPGIYEWGLGGFRHDDTVVVGSRPDVLTKSPKDLVSQTIL